MGEGDGPLVLGPMLRYVDETSAGIWVETREAGRVTVRAGGRSWEHGTFAVHGHHYALVEVEGLEPGTRTPYEVDVDGTRAWPPTDSPFPAPVVATLEPGRRLRMAWGSCRTSVPHDESGTRTHGVDALRAYALRLAEDDRPWPDLVLHLGDQVYADETSDEMREFIAARIIRALDEQKANARGGRETFTAGEHLQRCLVVTHLHGLGQRLFTIPVLDDGQIT